MITANELWPKRDATGEDGARKKLAMGACSPQKVPLVKEWLSRKNQERLDASNRDRDDRESEICNLSAEANSIAREGNAISERSLIAALVAVVITAVALWAAIATAVVDAGK